MKPLKNTGLAAKRRKNKRKKLVRYFILFAIVLLSIVAIYQGDFMGVINNKIIGDISNNKTEEVTATVTPTAADTHVVKTNDDINEKKQDLDWKLILVNAWNAMPDNYTVNLMTLQNDYQVDERIYPELQKMFDDARNEGIYPLIVSAYRTKAKQQSLYNDKVNEYVGQGYKRKEAENLANGWVALPGYSEHQVGLALDINAEADKCTDEKVYSWLNKNSYKYGFIMRYPPQKSNITGSNYEPWHYRYVGKEAAQAIYQQGICLEEYLKELS